MTLARALMSVAALAMSLLAGCATAKRTPPPPLVLISLDAFRWDYTAMHPAETPHLREMIRNGVTAKALVPAFPTVTFPNHYTTVTGLYPARHGMIHNHMFDPSRGEFFNYNQPHTARQSQWWGGEPIWVTAIKQGGAAGCWFWPGSEAEIKGVRPDYWRPFDPKLPFEPRLNDLVDWLGNVDRTKPAVATFYIEEINGVGHRAGPGSPELARAIAVADQQIATLRSRLEAAGVEANFVIVSDHGMTPIDNSRILLLDDYIDIARVQVDFDGPVAGLRPRDGDVDALVRALSRAKHARVYRVEDLPARFHLRGNPRIPPVWFLPDEGWGVYTRRRYESFEGRLNKGDHGYDPALPSMQGIFIASGPSFRRGVEVPATESIHVYNLMCAALGLQPAPNDGDDRLVKAALRR